MSAGLPRLVIVGASGHGKVVADVARLVGYVDIVFLDADPLVTSCEGYPVVGLDSALPEIGGDVFVAIGDAVVRRTVMERNLGRNYPTLVHPDAVVARSATIGPGTVIMAGAVVNSGTTIGSGVIVNTCASVDHDCVVGDFCHVSVGARLCGTVIVSEGAWVGAGAVVSNNISVCAGCMIGAGATVVNDLDIPGTYVGVPARRLEPGDKHLKRVYDGMRDD